MVFGLRFSGTMGNPSFQFWLLDEGKKPFRRMVGGSGKNGSEMQCDEPNGETGARPLSGSSNFLYFYATVAHWEQENRVH
jgi:hypothetical protein